MITQITIERLFEIYKAYKRCKKDTVLVKLMSNAVCFYEHKLCRIYEISKKGRALGVICVCFSGVSVYMFKGGAKKELVSFLSLSPFSSIEGQKGVLKYISKKLNLALISGKCMKKVSPSLQNSSPFEVSRADSIKEFYDTLTLCNKQVKAAEYDAYYGDVFYRMSKGAVLLIAKQNENAVGCGGIFHLYDSVAVISDVAVLEQKRHMGCGSKIVLSLCDHAFKNGYTPYLLCRDKSIERLYKKLGFKSCGSFAVLLTN